MTDSKPVVLFLCTANTSRSQMAEALLRHAAGARFRALSAGLKPGEAVHPLALRVLSEKNIDTAGLRPKDVREFLGTIHIHTAIFVCPRAAEACPVTWPGAANRVSWPIDDPAEVEGTETERLDAYRRARDTIEARISEWLAGLDQD